MATLNNLNSKSADATEVVSTRGGYVAHTVSSQASKRGQQIYRQAQVGLAKAQIAAAVGIALLKGLLNNKEMKARKSQRRARHVQHAVQDKLQPVWSKTQDVIQAGRETTQDLLETTQERLQKRAKHAQKDLKKARKRLKHMQKSAQKNLESGWSTAQDGLKSGWSATQDKLGESSQQARKSMKQVSSNMKDARKTAQKRYKHYQHKRARARMLFRWGLVAGVVLALLFTPVTGLEARERIKQLWERYKQSSFE